MGYKRVASSALVASHCYMSHVILENVLLSQLLPGILLLAVIYYGVGESLSIQRRVGDSVALPAPSDLNVADDKPLEVLWKYKINDIVEYKSNVKYLPSNQFNGRLEFNTKNFSLTVRDLKLGDSGDYIFTGEYSNVQIPAKTVTLMVYEHVSKVVIDQTVRLLANHSCSVHVMCNAPGNTNVIYTWKRGNKTYANAQQMDFHLSPADGPTNVTCTVSNNVSEQSDSTTVSCSNEKRGMLWYLIYIGIPVGGAVVVILIVAVVVSHYRGRNTDDQMDNTIYSDVDDIAKVKDTRSNSDENPMSIYETVKDQTIPRQTPPNTVYDQITFGRSVS
ncbi:hypothetical protein DPEC_G00095590 [Dallia pectoralis]|uniref:Uncharacterized protein n=1 Tax=Dallia pectoralis TaxID=75939 RepID=A0ACC2GV32_DALPE|nr:hypothetical protein DPEC_G00095590 [Dallia pectoralis]